jgi:transcriptional regulator with AAA-type ATPase domain
LNVQPVYIGCMLLFSPAPLPQVEAAAGLVYCNPFLPERIALERQMLLHAHQRVADVWDVSGVGPRMSANLRAIRETVTAACETARARLVDGSVRPTPREAQLYEDLVLYALYAQHNDAMERAIADARAGRPARGVGAAFESVRERVRHYFDGGRLLGVDPPDPATLFAGFFQIRRAFDEIFNSIIGASMPAARLRAAIWQSIFTHDMRRYRRSLYDRTGDFTTLIVGPSGTGKELVARAIAASRYIPFDLKTKSFTEDFSASFYPLNLSALSPTLVESELFGHRRGAFTGAVDDRAGWLQSCPPLGTVFLDEIGELDPAIQVKLLRVLQTRQFQRLGDTKTIMFRGKIMAATNRDLGKEMDGGSFRRDFYYRLCGDIVTTPSLREQLSDSRGDELRTLVGFVAARLVPVEDAAALTDETMASIAGHLGRDYAWPGNFRELEQCVRNVLVRGEYRPTATGCGAEAPRDELSTAIADGTLTADELLSRYCAHVYGITGTYEATALRLGLDRRTVAARVKAMQHR